MSGCSTPRAQLFSYAFAEHNLPRSKSASNVVRSKSISNYEKTEKNEHHSQSMKEFEKKSTAESEGKKPEKKISSVWTLDLDDLDTFGEQNSDTESVHNLRTPPTGSFSSSTGSFSSSHRKLQRVSGFLNTVSSGQRKDFRLSAARLVTSPDVSGFLNHASSGQKKDFRLSATSLVTAPDPRRSAAGPDGLLGVTPRIFSPHERSFIMGEATPASAPRSSFSTATQTIFEASFHKSFNSDASSTTEVLADMSRGKSPESGHSSESLISASNMALPPMEPSPDAAEPKPSPTRSVVSAVKPSSTSSTHSAVSAMKPSPNRSVVSAVMRAASARFPMGPRKISPTIMKLHSMSVGSGGSVSSGNTIRSVHSLRRTNSIKSMHSVKREDFLPLKASSIRLTSESGKKKDLTDDTASEERRLLALELLTSEGLYLESLECMLALRQYWENKGVLKDGQPSIIFPNLPDILELHLRFFQQIEELHSHWSAQSCVGSLFLDFAQEFREHYIVYVGNFHAADVELSKLLRDPAMHAVLAMTVERLTRGKARLAGLDLRSLLIMPVQRLPRFGLWIETLIETTPSRFRDAPELKKALALIREVTSYVEAQAHRKQGLYKAKALQSKFKPQLDVGEQALVMQGTMEKVSSNYKMMERSFFLFEERLFVYAKKETKREKSGGSVTQYTQYTKWKSDTLLGVQSLVRTNNRTKKQTWYGSSKVENPVSTRETMMEKFMSESEFYFFFVHGHHMQLWVNAGNEATLLEWMEVFECLWQADPLNPFSPTTSDKDEGLETGTTPQVTDTESEVEQDVTPTAGGISLNLASAMETYKQSGRLTDEFTFSLTSFLVACKPRNTFARVKRQMIRQCGESFFHKHEDVVIALVVTLDRVDEALGPYTEECLAGFVQLMMWSAPAIPAFEALKHYLVEHFGEAQVQKHGKKIRMALAKLKHKAGPDTGGAKLIAQVGFQTLQQVAWVLTDPSRGTPANVQNSLLMCLPCFATPRIFVATLKFIFDKAGSDPQNDFLRQQKVLLILLKWINSDWGVDDFDDDEAARSMAMEMMRQIEDNDSANSVFAQMAPAILQKLESVPTFSGASTGSLRKRSVSSGLVASSKGATPKPKRPSIGSNARRASKSEKSSCLLSSKFKFRIFAKKLYQSLDVKLGSNQTPDISILSTEMVAAQLTTEDFLCFMKVRPRELINQQWLLNDVAVAPRSIAAITELTARRINLFMSLIFHHQKFKRNIISFLIAVAKNFLKSHNLNGFHQVVTCLNHKFLGRQHFPELWKGIKEKEQQLVDEYTELLDSGPTGKYEAYHAHINMVHQNAKGAIPVWDIFLKELYKVQTRRPWTIESAGPDKRQLLNMAKAMQVHDMIIESGSPRKWNVKHLQDLQGDERIKKLLAHMHIISLDAEEIALRADAQQKLMAQQSPRRRSRRMHSAPSKLDVRKLAKIAKSNSRKKGRKSIGASKSFSPHPSHPLNIPRTPPVLIKSRSECATMHRRLRTSMNEKGFSNRWKSADDSMIHQKFRPNIDS